MRTVAALVLLSALATAARAETPVSPEAFEAMTEGRTLHFRLGGVPFGAEQFLPGRRTLWRFAEDACEPGRWYGEGDAICFVYETQPGPICWRFLRDGEDFTAALIEDGAETGFHIDLDRIEASPLACLGPNLGS